MFNLLIFFFCSNTFNNIEKNANEIWKFNNFKLIYSYRLYELDHIKLWPAPPPFNLIYLFFKFVYYFISKNSKNHKSINESVYLDDSIIPG